MFSYRDLLQKIKLFSWIFYYGETFFTYFNRILTFFATNGKSLFTWTDRIGIEGVNILSNVIITLSYHCCILLWRIIFDISKELIQNIIYILYKTIIFTWSTLNWFMVNAFCFIHEIIIRKRKKNKRKSNI